MPSASGRHWAADSRRSNGHAAALAFLVVAAHSVIVGGCEKALTPQAAHESAGRVPSPSTSAGSYSFIADALWREARNGTEIEWQRLANREGAAGLISVALLDDEWGLVALRCLPFADDAPVALGFLCEAAEKSSGERLRAVLASLHAIAAEPPRDTEEPAPDAVPRCRESLSTMAHRTDLPAGEHDLAASALRMLDERVR